MTTNQQLPLEKIQSIMNGQNILQSSTYHFIREAIEKDIVQPEYCRLEEQLADILTKALSNEKFCHLRELINYIGVVQVSTRVSVGINSLSSSL